MSPSPSPSPTPIPIPIQKRSSLLDVYIDADACPVKEEIYRVAGRYRLKVYLVSNRPLHHPLESWIAPVIVGNKLDAADDWIAEHIQEKDLLITADILLAARCLKVGARVLGPKGVEFTEDSIGEDLANREIFAHLRTLGEVSGGSAPFEKKDRSRFLSKIDQIIQNLKRSMPVLKILEKDFFLDD